MGTTDRLGDSRSDDARHSAQTEVHRHDDWRADDPDATVVRALIVPAAVALFGRWNWWMPQTLARILRTPTRPMPDPEGSKG